MSFLHSSCVLLEDLVDDWRKLDRRIEAVTAEIETLAKQHEKCRRLMAMPGIGPLIASAMIAAIGDGAAFIKGRDFAAWLGLVPKQISTGDRTISAASAGAAIDIFAPYSFKVLVRFFSGLIAGRTIASLAGLRMRRGVYTKMFWP